MALQVCKNAKLFQSQIVFLIQKRQPYTGNLNSETHLGTVKTHFYTGEMF